jgi:soluble P-type ATPase
MIRRHGTQSVVALGNGRNDRLMLAEATLGIGVLGDEGIARKALLACDIVVRHRAEAFDLREPRPLLTGLRS